MDSGVESQTTKAVSSRLGEVLFVGGLLLFAIAAFVATFWFRSVDWDPLGLAFWPRILAAGLIVCLVIRFWYLRSHVGDVVEAFWRPMAIFGLCCLFVIGYGTIGIYLTAPPFFVAIALLAPVPNKRRTALISLGIACVVLAVIGVVLDYALGIKVTP